MDLGLGRGSLWVTFLSWVRLLCSISESFRNLEEWARV